MLDEAFGHSGWIDPEWALIWLEKNILTLSFPIFTILLLWLFPPLLFHLSILSEVWLLNFLRNFLRSKYMSKYVSWNVMVGFARSKVLFALGGMSKRMWAWSSVDLWFMKTLWITISKLLLIISRRYVAFIWVAAWFRSWSLKHMYLPRYSWCLGLLLRMQIARMWRRSYGRIYMVRLLWSWFVLSNTTSHCGCVTVKLGQMGFHHLS